MGTRVFVGGIRDQRVRERDIEDFFKGYGRVREVTIKPGYAFVEFEDLRDAEDAVYEKNGKSLNGDRVVVEHAMRPGSGKRQRPRTPPRRAPPPQRSRYRVQVENVSSRASWRDLKALMANAGEVVFCDAHRHVNGEGHCEFESRKGMERALDELDGKELHGKRIKLRVDKSRSRSPRRRRSRSRSKSRSRSQRKSGSRSKSRSKSPAKRKEKEDKSRSRSKSRSKSRSPPKKSKRSASRSKSPAKKSNRSKSRSKSPVKKRNRSKSRSKSPAKRADKSRSRSRSPAKRGRKSRSRSRSRSGSKASDSRRSNARSATPSK